MSLAYKLWKIGNVLKMDDMRKCIQESSPLNDPVYININFKFDERNQIQSVALHKKGIAQDKFFFSKRIGGSGTGIYYLYPNVILQKGHPAEKLNLLVKTLDKSINIHAGLENRKYSKQLMLFFQSLQLKNKHDNIERNDVPHDLFTDWEKVNEKIKEFEKGDYIFFFSINDKTFYELMPEVWENWYQSPVIKNKDAKPGYDILTNSEAEIGFRPEIKVFSYDQYHNSHNYRINENVPLSKNSARNIKFAWIFILNNLVFNYKGLEFVIIPNLLIDNSEMYRKILYQFASANRESSMKKGQLEKLYDKEEKLKKELGKVKIKKNKIDKKYQQLTNETKCIGEDIKNIELGFFTELNEYNSGINDMPGFVTLDYIFTAINKTDLSFEIKGSIEDVLPSKIGEIVAQMRKHNIDDLIKIKKRDLNKTFLQDYFNRDELYFIVNRSQSNNKNRIFKERFYLAQLLLTNQKLELDTLLKTFSNNREYKYDRTKRVNKEGTKDWIEYPGQFVLHEQNIYHFFRNLDKIKE